MKNKMIKKGRKRVVRRPLPRRKRTKAKNRSKNKRIQMNKENKKNNNHPKASFLLS